MARWKLTADHYLSVVGTTYRTQESTLGGQDAELNLPCPRLLEINNPKAWNSVDEFGFQIVTVAHPGSKVGRDYVFTGDPTPDMVPLDAEAEEITGGLRAGWDRANGPLAVGTEDYTKALVDKIIAAPPPPADDKVLELLAGQNAILAKLAEAVTPRRL